MRLVVSGGGTGGHVYPALAVLEELLARGVLRREDVRFVASPGGMEVDLIRRAGLPLELAQTGQVRGRAPWVVAGNAVRMVVGSWQVRRWMREFRPDVVLLTGGYVGVPVALAARTCRVPICIYLPDLEPGLAVRLLARLAQRVAVTAEKVVRYFPRGKAVVTGYPVRRAVAEAERAGARQRLGLDPGMLTLLVTGGSRGARSINLAVSSAAERILRHWQVVHITGLLDYETVQAAREAVAPELKSRYHVYAYLHEEMPLALAAADLVVARAGASVLGEFPVRGLPAVLVPYPYAGQHQEVNAAFLVERGAAVRVSDARLGEDLPGLLERLAAEPTRLREMAERSRALARPEAAWAVAQCLLDLAARSPWRECDGRDHD
ncbi:MAG: UDP-N-acetylglucosamine--N-acetylmuramyl-(pentapeptide) pyrophosphoryl-undecaprenol N-acetylglucosamine transferase [Anaerolineae bacterium]